MEKTYTPGPWKVDTKLANTFDIADIGTKYKTVCSLSAYEHRCCSIDETNANAHLIAAAPELLEALQGLVKFIQSNGISIPAEVSTAPIGIAKAAISKALNK